MPVWFWALASFTSVIIWAKCFFFLRCLESTSFFVTMLRQVAEGTKPFLGLLLVIVLAFASSFNFHSKFVHASSTSAEAARVLATCPDLIDGSKPLDSVGEPCVREEPKEIPQYLTGFARSVIFSYLLTLGEFDVANNEGSVVGWSLFVVASLLSQVVMLNLLVAIFSATHARAVAGQARLVIGGLAGLVREVQALRPFAGEATAVSERPVVYDKIEGERRRSPDELPRIGKLLFHVRLETPPAAPDAGAGTTDPAAEPPAEAGGQAAPDATAAVDELAS